jgi:cyclopropane fatty-acyl-phospholipid synthase-like methyltransferase
MKTSFYRKAAKYPDLETIYTQCSGPGGLKLAEFMAEKMGLRPGARLLDVGMNRGYQTCFLAKEYRVFVVGIDPWEDRDGTQSHVDYLMDNARSWGVEDLVLGVQVGVPDTRFAASSFDFVYSTTALEMIRGMQGEEAYVQSVEEIHRVLKPGGIFGLGEPMHLDVEIPLDLAPLVSEGEDAWTKFFATLGETVAACRSVGFEILEAEHAPDALVWWLEYAQYDPYCRVEPEGEPRTIQVDDGRWLSFGYVIGRKTTTMETILE